MIDTILKYFPHITAKQREQYELMMKLYPEWNEKINVISRKDIENLEVNHVLHSLAIAKFISLANGSSILDLGTGGGFPGIPLAVMFPDVNFHLIDRIGKKIKVAQDIAEQLELKNVTFQHGDMGECHDKFDFVVSRAVMLQSDIIRIVGRNILKEQRNGYPNGLITLKGGDLNAEVRAAGRGTETISISQYFSEPFFETKKIIYTPLVW
jgi:16S rRNA (guanine527-N7)-methyltransferase